MSIVTITLSDNPADHSVSVHSSFTPAVGGKLSPAQAISMELIMVAARQWQTKVSHVGDKPIAAEVQVANYGSAEGIDIDRVHRQRGNVVLG